MCIYCLYTDFTNIFIKVNEYISYVVIIVVNELDISNNIETNNKYDYFFFTNSYILNI